MKGVVQGWVINGFSRIMQHAPYWILPVGIGESNMLHSTHAPSGAHFRCFRALGPSASRQILLDCQGGIVSDRELTCRLRCLHVGKEQVRVLQLEGGPPRHGHG